MEKEPKQGINSQEGNDAKSEAAKREEHILEFWKEKNIFEKTLEKNSPKGDFVFYDGPPFATGTPHYGHLGPSAMKDAVPRFWTMRGYHVERQWGWDCHGLPIENIVEKELGTKTKKDIEEIGVARFNQLCREKIFTYVDVWNKAIPRFGRWADMDNPYRTMDPQYMESEWWAFKELYNKGLVYEDYRIMYICPRCETTLAQAEVAEGYTELKDLSATAKFELLDEPGTHLLAWTTTPWTLPGNVALAVGKDIVYSIIEKDDEGGSGKVRFVVAKELLGKIFEDSTYDLVAEVKGRELVGKAYKPLFDYYSSDESLENREQGWKVYAADFVSTEEGTGIVHIAPAFGEEDMELGRKENLPFVQHVNMNGTFREEVRDFAGMQAKPKDDPQATDIEIIKYLAHNNLLFSKEKIAHSYPLCWRCDTPLLNYATSSWFVAVQKIKDDLLENAKHIKWSPAHIDKGRWTQWLLGARDWSISRQRFWANTIPVWRCKSCKEEVVFGSASELSEASGKEVRDLHKDVVDEVTVPCEKCNGEMKRVPDVLDTWFDSGSVPFASYHYPFENEAKVMERIPADFIAEGLDQVSKWFYYQHVLASGLFGKNAFTNVIVNGIVLAEDGKKMSKRLKNYPDPEVMINKYGADAVRLYMLSSPVVRAENLNFAESGVDEVAKKTIGRLANTVSFLKMYEKGTEASAGSKHVLDRWILSKLNELIQNVTDAMEKYELDRATRPLSEFVDDLSTWYVRRSRDRMKEEGEDRDNAEATLRYTLLEFAKVSAPFIPFISEWIWHEVGGEEESVHLAEWPEAGKVDEELLKAMEEVREIVSVGLQLRSDAGINVRQPLQTLRVRNQESGIRNQEQLDELIRDEVNVKEVTFGAQEDVLDTEITPELQREGRVREIIREIQSFRKKEDLSPGDVIEVTITATKEDEGIVKEFEEEIKDATNVSAIAFEEGNALEIRR